MIATTGAEWAASWMSEDWVTVGASYVMPIIVVALGFRLIRRALGL